MKQTKKLLSGAKLCYIRGNISQQAFSDQFNDLVKFKTYQSWEEGRAVPKASVAIEIARKYSIEIADLLNENLSVEDFKKKYKGLHTPGNEKNTGTSATENSNESTTTPNSMESEQLSEKDRRLLDIMDKWATAIVDANITAKELAFGNNSLIGILKGTNANSVPSLEEKVDHIFQTLAAEKVGRVAVQTLLLREIAKKDGRKYEDVYNEFLDNELAEAAGVQPKASSRQGRENVGRKDKAAHTSS